MNILTIGIVIAVIVILLLSLGSEEGGRYVYKGNTAYQVIPVKVKEYQWLDRGLVELECPYVNEFLKEHPFLLRLDYELVDPKPQLSSDIIPDFIIKTHRGEYIVIELEHPKKRLFTTDEYLSEYKDLKNAKAQIEKYLDFIRNQIGCLRSKYSDISAEKIRGLLLIGLSSDLTDKEKERLKRINARLMDYEIKTYDELIESLRQFLRNLGGKYGARM